MIDRKIQEITQDLAQEFGARDTMGALFADILDDSPAAQARLERGDIITAYNGPSVRDPGQLRSLVADTVPGTTVTLSILRDKKAKDVTVKIGELPEDLSKTSRYDTGSGKGEHVLAGVTVEDLNSRRERFRGRKGLSGVVVTQIEADSVAHHPV